MLVLSILTASQSASAVNSGGVQEIPFEFRDGLIWINVTVASLREPLHFLLDSGAQVSVINEATAQRLGIKPGRQVTVASVGATTTGFYPQIIDAHAGAVPLPRTFLMLDMQKLSDSCTNSAVDGIAGADFFRGRIVQIDFEKQLVRILPEQPAEAGAQVVPLKLRRSGLLVPIQVNDAFSQWVRLDTGCASALQWVSTAVGPERCTRRMAVALTKFSLPVTDATVVIAGHRFEHVPTDLHTQEIFPGEKGLLGNGLLSRYRTVTIDSKGGKLLLCAARREAE